MGVGGIGGGGHILPSIGSNYPIPYRKMSDEMKRKVYDELVKLHDKALDPNISIDDWRNLVFALSDFQSKITSQLKDMDVRPGPGRDGDNPLYEAAQAAKADLQRAEEMYEAASAQGRLSPDIRKKIALEIYNALNDLKPYLPS